MIDCSPYARPFQAIKRLIEPIALNQIVFFRYITR